MTRDAQSNAASAPAANPSSVGQDLSAFAVPYWLDLLGGMVSRHSRFWIRLGNLESNAAASDLERVSVAAPIYISGFARSGSTLLHEIVASHPSVATHRVKDYPFVFNPFWWRRASSKWRTTAARERAHGDRITITGDSPEALEEMLWMAFFPGCHDPARSNVLGPDTRHPEFESFYRGHIGKLLVAEVAARYAAKANYHVARLAYLVRLFPDAKIILPVRSPADHIASLLRQHQRFSEAQSKYPRALAYMRRSGHFEFGLDRRPLNLGDSSRVDEVLSCWSKGDDLRGYALSWEMVYAYLARLLAEDERVKAATFVVRYEALCKSPRETLDALMRHVDLADADPIVDRFASVVAPPDYYRRQFSPEEEAVIADITSATAAAWGYG